MQQMIYCHCSHVTNDICYCSHVTNVFLVIVHMLQMIFCHCSLATNDYFVMNPDNSLFTRDKCFLVFVHIPQIMFVFRNDMMYTFLMQTVP